MNLSPARPVAPATAKRLRRNNAIAAVLHLVQGIVVVALANGFSLPVAATFLSGQPGQQGAELTALFDFPYAWGVAAFLFLSALAHAVIVSPWYFPVFLRQVAAGKNYARWVEYSLSSSLMVVLIALLVGVSDAGALVALAGVNAAMILFGLVQEKYEQPGKGSSLLSFWFGCIAGAIPWLIIAFYLWAPGVDAAPPTFVYWIFVSLFVFFNCFAIVMVLQYRKVGKWAAYVYGEHTYVVLSLVAKSLLAWQIFAGALAG